MDFSAPLCVEFRALYVDFELNTDFFVTTITKIKRFFMGALVGALITRNISKTNGKQHVNRGYDSESGTTI
jgi:hypothetical protein